MCSPPGPRPRRPASPDGAPGEGGEGPSLPGTLPPPRCPRTREVSPLSPRAGSGVSGVTAVLRAPGVGRPTAAPRCPRRGNYFGESCPRRGGEGRAHGRLARLLCCHSESRVIKLRLVRAASSGARLWSFRGRASGALWAMNGAPMRSSRGSGPPVLAGFPGLAELVVLWASPVHSPFPGSSYPSVVYAA